MPVLRKRMEVMPRVQQSGVLRSAPSPMGQVIGQVSQSMLQISERVGRVMALEAEDEGRALARAAAFTLDENGNPQMPPDIQERLGRLGRRAYDLTMEDQFGSMMNTRVQQIVNEEFINHPFDLPGAQAAAQERLAELGATVPDSFRSAFQLATESALVGATTTMSQQIQSLAIQTTANNVPVMVEQWTNTIREATIVGDEVGARGTLDAGLAILDAMPDYVLTPAQRQNYRNDLVLQTGIARMENITGVGRGELTVGQITRLQEALFAGAEDPDFEYLQELFTAPGSSTPNYQLMEQAANHLSQYLSAANQRQTAAIEAAREQGATNILLAGGGTDTAENRGRIDRTIAGDLGLTDQSGAPRAINPMDWAGMTPGERTDALQRISDTGVPSESMNQFFRMIWNQRDVSALEAGYSLYRDMEEAPNSAGIGNDLRHMVPEDVRAIYEIMDAMTGGGEVSTYNVEQAAQLWEAQRSGPLDGEALARRLEQDGVRNRNGGITAENAGETFRNTVLPTIFDGIDATTEERRQAITLATALYQTGNLTVDEVAEQVRSSMSGRFVDSPYMNDVRSSRAPEIHYNAPPATNILEWWQGVVRNDWAGFTHGLEGIAGEWWLDVIIPGDLWDGLGPDIDFGADRMNASPFDLIADRQIREMIDQADWWFPDDARYNLANRSLLRGGEDYTLIPVEGSGTPPTYHVWVQDPETQGPRPLGILDPREEFERLHTLDVNLRSIDGARDNRMWQALANDPRVGLTSIEGWMLEQAVTMGDEFAWDVALQQLYDQYFEGRRE